MINILQIETSSTVCSAAVSANGKCLSVVEQDERNIHAGSLTLFIEQAMKESGLKFTDLHAVAVAMGPGSYTGLRIGVSTVKGLCYALDLPMIAINTLKMMAAGFKELHPDFTGLLAPMLDARRMEVYTALFNNKLETLNDTSAVIIDGNFHSDKLSKDQVAFFGDGAEKCRTEIDSANALFTPGNYNSARYLSAAAYQAFLGSDFVDLAYFEPHYLKDFVVTTPRRRTLH